MKELSPIDNETKGNPEEEYDCVWPWLVIEEFDVIVLKILTEHNNIGNGLYMTDLFDWNMTKGLVEKLFIKSLALKLKPTLSTLCLILNCG